jgi:hypothetical protein
MPPFFRELASSDRSPENFVMREKRPAESLELGSIPRVSPVFLVPCAAVLRGTRILTPRTRLGKTEMASAREFGQIRFLC